ncbi:MAG: cysteine-rich CWC family protein [Vitreoscilla sp.]|nr:cysteine-rich CWC family protein [Vitreoscilla sp.]
MTTTPPSTCPRCGGGFACGAAGPAPCACQGVALSAERLAQLRQRYTGCLCLACLVELATERASEPPRPGDSPAP